MGIRPGNSSWFCNTKAAGQRYRNGPSLVGMCAGKGKIQQAQRKMLPGLEVGGGDKAGLCNKVDQ